MNNISFCICGCGEIIVQKYKNKTLKYIHGHNNRNRKFTQEHKNKISKGNKNKVRTEETKQLLSNINKGKKLSEETKQKMSRKHKLIIFTDEHKHKISLSKKDKKFTEEHKNKLSLIKKGKITWIKGKKHKESSKKKMSEWRLLNKVIPFKDTKIEVKIQNFLKELNIKFIPHKYINNIEHGYQCDMYVPNTNLIIECDGDYWHGNNKLFPILFKHQIEQQEKDNIRTKELLEKGFKILRMWETDINKMSLEEFRNKIECV